MTPEEEKRINDRFEQIESTLDRIDDDLEILASHVLAHEEAMTTLIKTMTELAQAQKHSDERLNTLILVVERYFSNGADRS